MKLLTKLNTFLSLLFFAYTLDGFSQSNPLDNKIEKIQELLENDKLTEAEKQTEKLVEKNPEYGKGWDLLAGIRYSQYKDSKKYDNILGNATITVKGGDASADSIKNLLQELKPSKLAWEKFINTLKNGTIHSNDAYNCSVYIRNIFVDHKTDTAVSTKALKYFENAEEQFGDKNYEKAIALYKRAIEEQPNFYKANLYLGDAYYFMKYYDEAINSFKEAVKADPNLLEPRKYLVDAYGKKNMYGLALEECINAIMVYPDLVMNLKMDDAAYFGNKKIDIKWTPRMVLPNKVSTKGISLKEDEAKDLSKTPWKYYVDALDKMKPYCNEKGLVTTSNALSKSSYLEVYSWEEMLKNSTDPSLEEAKRMKTKGYLDCYVFVTCFHYDFYDQYLDFVAKNRDKISDYFNAFIQTRK